VADTARAEELLHVVELDALNLVDEADDGLGLLVELRQVEGQPLGDLRDEAATAREKRTAELQVHLAGLLQNLTDIEVDHPARLFVLAQAAGCPHPAFEDRTLGARRSFPD